MNKKYITLFLYNICIFLFIIFQYIIYFNTVIYINTKNTLCYSWIPYNMYISRNGLCNINCSYVRRKQFPANIPLKCKINYSQSSDYKNSINNNIYIFNTSTYGKYVEKYRYYYKETSVYYSI